MASKRRSPRRKKNGPTGSNGPRGSGGGRGRCAAIVSAAAAAVAVAVLGTLVPVILVVLFFFRRQRGSGSAPPEESGPGSFETHCAQIHRSAMVGRSGERETVGSRFVLLRTRRNDLGLGNRLRSLIGAMFVAALTDRVLLLEDDMISTLFAAPVAPDDGLVLDWNSSLARGAGDDDDGKKKSTTVKTLPMWRRIPNFRDEYDRNGTTTCIIVEGPHGHDRLLAVDNGDGGGGHSYADGIARLFGGRSRFRWTRRVASLLLQRPAPSLVRAASDAVRRVGLAAGAPPRQQHRIGVQYRTYALDDRGGPTKKSLEASDRFWKCVVSIVKEQVAQAEREKVEEVVVLFVSDLPELREEAVRQLAGVNVRVVDTDTDIVHTGRLSDNNNLSMADYMDWFLLAECDTVIATGTSSFAMSAFFRPSTFFPSSHKKKRLFTVDGLERYGGNPVCGEIHAKDYNDFIFGNGEPRG
jgi:hypothetical protein